MPLSKPAPREHMHTRTVTCRGYRREDGLWDVEGHLVDTKTYAFDNAYRGTVEAGTPVHEMWLRLTLDDRLVVQEAEAVTEHGPFRICPDVTPNFRRLAGLRIAPGWNRRVRQLLGGTEGCTHLVELLGPMATTAYQTMAGKRRRERQEDKAAERPAKRPFIIDSCHAWASDGDVVKAEFPAFYTGD